MNTLALISLLILALTPTIFADLTAPGRNYNVTSPVTNGPYVVDQFLPCTYRLMGNVDSTSLHLQIILKPILAASGLSGNAAAATVSGSGVAADASAPPSAVAPIAAASPTSSILGATTSNNNGSSIQQQQQPIVITDNADVSKTEASAKHEGNTTYYEHSINYKIPLTVKPGRYNVVFFDTSTNTELPIPIEIRSAAVPASPTAGSGGKTSGGASNGSTNDGHSQSIFAGAAAAAPIAESKLATVISLAVSLVLVILLRT